MALSDINKDELQDFAEARNVDSSGKKDELVQRLEEQGFSEDDVNAFQEGTAPEPEAVVQQSNEDEDTNPVEEENKRVEEATGLRAAEEDDDEDKILIRLAGPFSSITTNGYRFTQDHPFVPVKRSVADELLESSSFRQAHPSEADEFYG